AIGVPRRFIPWAIVTAMSWSAGRCRIAIEGRRGGCAGTLANRANLIGFLVAFKAMAAAKTFMSQGNWSERAATRGGLFPCLRRGQSRLWPSLTHCEDFA